MSKGVPHAEIEVFIDTHDRARETFPAEISKKGLAGFLAQYGEACRAEGVVQVKFHFNLETGIGYCLNMAPDADAIRRAHERVGLPFDRIDEVQTVTPGDLYFEASV